MMMKPSLVFAALLVSLNAAAQPEIDAAAPAASPVDAAEIEPPAVEGHDPLGADPGVIEGSDAAIEVTAPSEGEAQQGAAAPVAEAATSATSGTASTAASDADAWRKTPLDPAWAVSGVRAEDAPNDNGRSITISWAPVSDQPVTDYVVLRRSDKAGAEGWEIVTKVQGGATSAAFGGAEPGSSHTFKVISLGAAQHGESAEVTATAVPQWFRYTSWPLLVLAVVISFSIIFFIEWIKRGGSLFLRKIAGLEALDESVGRATEMGRPVLFVPGIMDMDDPQTLAGLTMLGHVSKTIAEYDTQLDVPVSRSLVMTTGREVVKQAFLEAGRPDLYYDDIVHYLTDEQFGYVAGVNGTIVRDRPATCIFMGSFFAESLLLAETGNSIGAIQIAGTAQPAQLPFFVAACDYTLIGEELFAASAYLSGDPKQLGSLKGQDVGKGVVMFGILAGSVFATLAQLTGQPWFEKALYVVHLFFPKVGG